MADGTRLLNLLGVEEDEKFTTKVTCFTFRVHRGLFQYEDCSGNWQTATCSTLCELIDDPSLVIRKPHFSDEEMTVLRWLHKYGRLERIDMSKDGIAGARTGGPYMLAVNIVKNLLKPGEVVDLDELFGAEND